MHNFLLRALIYSDGPNLFLINVARSIKMEAYCVKCRDKVTIDNPEQVTLKNGRPATKGTCSKSDCDTNVFRIGKSS